jgi:hypothetical protein
MTITLQAFALNFDAGSNVAFELTPDQVTQLLSHPNVAQHLVMIGLKNTVQDSHASVVRKDFESDDAWIAAKREKAALKLGAMLNGELRTGSGTRQPKLSDREAFARKWLVAKLKALFVAKHGKESWKEKTEGDSGAEFISGLVEKFAPKFAEDIEAAWQLELAEKAKQAKIAAEVDFDI